MPREVRNEFLKKLHALLGSSRSQSSRVLEEIEDHLISQHEELVERGMDHDQAWQKVIDEFGDVNEFIGSQSQLDREIRWRWMMRYTTLTILGAFGILVGFMAMAPDNSRLRTAPAVAQEQSSDDPFGEGGGAPAAESQVDVVFVEGSDDELIREKLDQRISIEMTQVDLKTLVEFLSEELEVDFFVDPDCGYTLDSLGGTQDLSFRSIRVSMLLDLVLREHGLSISVVDGIVMVHDAYDSEWNSTVRVYNVTGLLSRLAATRYANPDESLGALLPGSSQFTSMTQFGSVGSGVAQEQSSSIGPGMMGGDGMTMGGGGMMGATQPTADAQLDSLMMVISQTIEPEGWMEMGGSNSISGIDGLIVVRAPEKVHTQIESLLEQMASALESKD